MENEPIDVNKSNAWQKMGTVGVWIYRLRSILLAIPVMVAAIRCC